MTAQVIHDLLRRAKLWQEDFVDRRVEAAILGLFEPESDAGLIRLLRRELPAIKPAEIRAAVKRVRSAAQPEAVIDGPQKTGQRGSKARSPAARVACGASSMGQGHAR
jgi:hypothetical protein